MPNPSSTTTGSITGIEVLRDRANRTLTIRQTRYIERIAALYGSEIGARAQSTPAGSTDVQRALFDKLEPAAECDRIPVTEFLKPLGTIGWPWRDQVMMRL